MKKSPSKISHPFHCYGAVQRRGGTRRRSRVNASRAAGSSLLDMAYTKAGLGDSFCWSCRASRKEKQHAAVINALRTCQRMSHVKRCQTLNPLMLPQGSSEEKRHAAEINASEAVKAGKVEPGVSYAAKAKGT